MVDQSRLSPVKFKHHKPLEWSEMREQYLNRIRWASKLRITRLIELEPHPNICAVVGAGPSVLGFAEKIREIKANELNLLMSVNAVHDWLIKQDIIPGIHVIFEPDLDDVTVALGGEPHPDVTYYVASHCNPFVFNQLRGFRRVLWHPFLDQYGYQILISKYFPGEFMVGGGHATFFRSTSIARILGYRDFELFGVDSSSDTGNSHMDGYVNSNVEPGVKIWGTNRTGELKEFNTTGGLAFQAAEFVRLCEQNHGALKIRIHGDGLLRYIHESRYPEFYERS